MSGCGPLVARRTPGFVRALPGASSDEIGGTAMTREQMWAHRTDRARPEKRLLTGLAVVTVLALDMARILVEDARAWVGGQR